MPISYQEQANLTCPSCGADVVAAIWLILDAQEQPMAVEALRRGELNRVVCPQCGDHGPAGAPLLFHDGLARQVVFVVAPGMAEHAWRDQARDLHALLVGAIPEEQRRPYLADVDIAQDLDGLARRLERMQRRRAAQPAESVADRASRDDTAQPPLLLAVAALLDAQTPEDLQRVLGEYPVLLAPATDLTLAQLADVAVEQRAHDVAESLQQARQVLSQVGQVRPPIAETELPAAALRALMQATSPAEVQELVQHYPLLLHPQVDALLAEEIEHALDSGHDRLASSLEERREAVAALRAAAIAQQSTSMNLEEAIEALLSVEGEAAIIEVLDHYPFLLDESALHALAQFAAVARASGDDELADYAIDCREMLRHIRDRLAG
ncbi:CpXC domain-containing protein [Candidatus Oscillochloris fontis]|uniref:CpXC domain-containing protein n=1 Tax=Candidatus Oscillochloris fontis TaxID=2496868 RepID=UPI00101CE55E|nr:CpXC domain-containing protein [Candidatus Oscillochloris fontis]